MWTKENNAFIKFRFVNILKLIHFIEAFAISLNGFKTVTEEFLAKLTRK